MESKSELRKTAKASRKAQADKDQVSEKIVERLLNLPEYRQASSVAFYIDVRDEVRTRTGLEAALGTDKRISVPYCIDNDLELFLLESMDELSTGMYGILEPSPELRPLPEKRVDAADVDLVVVPGVGFDPRGARMGHGAGYYDRLLSRVRPDALLIALAYECQVFESIPTDPHDVFMHKIVTETMVRDCQAGVAADG